MLSRAVYDWNKVLQNFSASVGHVCKVVRADNPTNVFIIKLIKPLAVVQSCWEYATLYDIYPEGTCETIRNIDGVVVSGTWFVYALLLSVLCKTNYKSYRMGMDVKRAIINIQNIPEACWYYFTCC